MANQYVPPKVWTMDSENGGQWASINRPDSGARPEKTLPIGEPPIHLYSMGTPNSKIPAMVDRSGSEPINVFESGNILFYLAEKFGHLLPTEAAPRAQVMNWLFWLQGSAPYLGGGFGHFYAYAPEKFEYPINRFAMEAKRQLDVLDKQLAKGTFIAGEAYSIADIAIWPWYGNLALGNAYNAAEFLDVQSYKHVQRWAKMMAERPAVQRGRIVNRTMGEEWERIDERHSAADIDAALAKKPA